ncbi:MAG TPA: DUF4175 family protein [Acetobacteraceae bacterium]|nr:DUF4175 family protein [Acetobacteraceae bacterium]
MTNRAPRPVAGLERRLRSRRALGFAALLFERLWTALWPPLGLAGVYACLALLDLPRRLPPLGQSALLGIFVLGVLVLLWRGVARVRAPGAQAVDRRLERDSGLPHRPLAALADRPSAADAVGEALWRAHLARSAAAITRLRVGLPRPGLARLDRRALRGGLVVALAACLGIAGADAPDRLWASLHPSLPRGPATPTTELQAWITPPAYTGVAPIFLKPGGEDAAPIRVPAGSKLVVSVTGGSGTPELEFGGQRSAFKALDAGSFQAERVLDAAGRLTVRRDGDALARWTLDVIPDLPPTAAWAGAPGPARARLHTALPWKASDDYGVTALRAELRLRDRPAAPPLIVPIPVPGNGKDAHGVAEPDLSAHPWAGLPVVVRLVARDAIGQEGQSDEARFVLPERDFRNPQARTLIAIRKGLSLHPEDRETALGALDAMLVAPGPLGNDTSAYINLSGIYYLLEFNQDAAAIPDAQSRLWELALRLEEGAASRTERALESAMRAARDAATAMRSTPDDAHRNALEQKLRELEQAIREHMQALAEQYRKEGLPPAAMLPNARRLTERDLQRMAEKAMQAARQGDTEQAERAIARLEQMLDALRQAHPMTAEERQRLEQQRKGREQMGAVQDLLNREGGVLDHTQERAHAAARTPQGTNPTEADRAHDARVQQALRRALGEVMQQLGDLTGKVPDGLGEADQDMQSAAKALGAGKDADAEQAEQQAIEALQKGGQEAAQQMAQKFGGGAAGQGEQGPMGDQSDGGGAYLSQDDGSEPGDVDGAGETEGTYGQEDGLLRGRDPLGRPTGPEGHGYDEGNDVNVPDHGAPRRTEQIEEELRRRDADRTRPVEERQYIERLLRQF